MKGTALIILCALALARGESEEKVVIEIELFANGCPVNYTIPRALPHEKYCNLFYLCNFGQLAQRRCPKYLVFNAAEEVCDWPVHVECGEKELFVFESESEEDEPVNPGGHGDPSLVNEICAQENSTSVLVASENCSQFYMCDTGRPVIFNCPDGLRYNYNLGICDWPFNVDCGNRTISVEDVKSSEILN